MTFSFLILGDWHVLWIVCICEGNLYISERNYIFYLKVYKHENLKSNKMMWFCL